MLAAGDVMGLPHELFQPSFRVYSHLLHNQLSRVRRGT